MNYAHGLNNDFVLTQEVNRQYSLILEGSSNFHNYSNSLVIPVKSRREVELLLLSLGAEVGVVMDRETRKLYPDIWEWLFGRTYPEVLAELKWSCREEDEVLDMIQRIPLPRTLSNSFIKLHQDEPMPEAINQMYVHKVNKDNVLISKPYQYGNMFYFNGYQETLEFNIDHNSNRLEELIIFEAARQASIASTHLAGLPIEGILIVLKTRIEYTKFVELDNPYLIRTIPVYKSRGGVCYCVYHLLQNRKSCARGYFTALAHKTKHAYNILRNKQRLS